MADEWKTTTLVLCAYGLFKEIRPSEPFLTDYLVGNQTGLTEDQVYHEVYPIWTYSYLAVLVFVFLFTDLLRYKSVIILEGFSYIVTWALLLWGYGLRAMQIMQVSYGIATSTEVAYFTYIYSKVPGHYYQKVTSFTRSALLIGRFLSGLLSQILIWTEVATFRDLNFIAFGMVIAATITSFFLPRVNQTVYFHRDEFEEDRETVLLEDSQRTISYSAKLRKSFGLLASDFVSSFSNLYILKWSLWWALGTCGNFQVGNYIQPLWSTIRASENSTESGELFNGGVEAATTLSGAILAFCFGFIHLNWKLVGEVTVAVISVIDAVVLYTMAKAETVWTAYVGYLVFRSLYQMMITVASFEVARSIKPDSYGLVFGFNTFLALSFQTILTAVVADSAGLGLDPREQFVVYAGYFAVVGCIYLVAGIVGCIRNGKARYNEEGLWIRPKRRTSTCSSRVDPPAGSIETHQ